MITCYNYNFYIIIIIINLIDYIVIYIWLIKKVI